MPQRCMIFTNGRPNNAETKYDFPCGGCNISGRDPMVYQTDFKYLKEIRIETLGQVEIPWSHDGD